MGITALLLVFLVPFMVGAIGLSDAPAAPINSEEGLKRTADGVFRLIFWLLTVVAIFFVLFAGYKYLTASGDPEKMKEANRQILYAVIALAVGMLAQGLPQLVRDLVTGFPGK